MLREQDAVHEALADFRARSMKEAFSYIALCRALIHSDSSLFADSRDVGRRGSASCRGRSTCIWACTIPKSRPPQPTTEKPSGERQLGCSLAWNVLRDPDLYELALLEKASRSFSKFPSLVPYSELPQLTRCFVIPASYEALASVLLYIVSHHVSHHVSCPSRQKGHHAVTNFDISLVGGLRRLLPLIP